VITAQTRVTPPKNSYTPAEDVELGLQAAAQAEQQLPILKDEVVTPYIQGIGRRLVASIPAELQHHEFRYTFRVVNVREINAFALPGGPMFVNRGMIEAAHNEGEIAGVMAHELSHVVLRHGTAQASKATKYEIGALAGAVLGAIVGGRVGNVIAQGTQFGLGAAFMRFSREFEHDADIEGSHIMARAGYDPRDMANMFKTIEQHSHGSGGPEWLSDHPNPGNRYAYITAEAQMLRVENPVRDTRGFQQAKAYLQTLAPAPTTEQATRDASAGRNTTPRGTSGVNPSGRVESPSSRMTSYNVGNLFRVSVPSNWREQEASNAVTFAPQGAYGQSGGQNVFTHGIEIGVARNETHDLQTATSELIDSLAQANPGMGRPSGYSRTTVGNRTGLRTVVSNSAETTTGRPETIAIYTTQLRDGSLFYAIGVAPRDEFGSYQNTFDRIVSSIQLKD
jgi:hypothetical protein